MRIRKAVSKPVYYYNDTKTFICLVCVMLSFYELHILALCSLGFVDHMCISYGVGR